MKVKLLVARAGLNVSYRPGDVVDVPPAEAARLIKRGKAIKPSQKTAPKGFLERVAEKAVKPFRGDEETRTG